MSLFSAATEAEIIPFPSASSSSSGRAANRMTVRDRIEALRWSDTATELGYSRVLIDTSEHEDRIELGDFILVYRQGANWASWGIGCTREGFMLWCPQTGATVAHYGTLGEALRQIQALT